MIRRLNFTGRRKIPRSRVTIRLEPEAGGPPVFRAEYDLHGLGFPGEASVFVEAYNALSYMRFAFGTVARRADPPSTRLDEVTRRPLPRFRLKVVDRRKRAGLLLGVADQILPLRPDEDESRRQPLLPVHFTDLGDRVWRLDLDDWPVLELNSRIEVIREVARSDEAFLALVYPEVVRRILRRAVITERQTDPEFDDSDWTTLWLRYACTLPEISPPPADASTAEAEAWVEEAVEAFCRARRVRTRYEAALAREGR